MTDLFSSYKLGEITLKNRIIMAPLTRSRANGEGVHGELAATYYAQRASAGLIIAEATPVSQQGKGYVNIPGIWSDEQVKGWQGVTKAVHNKDGKIFLQMFHMGRVGHSSIMGEQPVSSTDVPPTGKVMAADFSMQDYETPRMLRADEIPGIVAQFKTGAENAKKAGFDGVEIHGANSYLIDQFLRDSTNKRIDEYGGSAENRARFLKEIVEAVIEVWGAGRVGVRLSPHNPMNDMSDSNPVETYSYVAKMLNDYRLAYVHIMEPDDASLPQVAKAFRKIYNGTLILNSGLTKASAEKALAEDRADLACFGTLFIANPDLVERFKTDAPLAKADPSLFYQGGEKGYIDYPPLTQKAA